MCHELSFVDGSVHGDLLLPPALQPHLKEKRNHESFGLIKRTKDTSSVSVFTYINMETFYALFKVFLMTDHSLLFNSTISNFADSKKNRNTCVLAAKFDLV